MACWRADGPADRPECGSSLPPDFARLAALFFKVLPGLVFMFFAQRRGEEDEGLIPHPKIQADRLGGVVWFIRFLLRAPAPLRENS